jgi:hypothetical protein
MNKAICMILAVGVAVSLTGCSHTADSAATGPTGPSVASAVGTDYGGTLTEVTTPGSSEEKSGTITFAFANQIPAIPHLLAKITSPNGSVVSAVQCTVDGTESNPAAITGATVIYDCGKIDEHQTATISVLVAAPSSGLPSIEVQLLGGEDAATTGASSIVSMTVGGK